MAYASEEYSYSRVAHASHVHRQKKTLRPAAFIFGMNGSTHRLI
jgi:hypothetical protein